MMKRNGDCQLGTRGIGHSVDRGRFCNDTRGDFEYSMRLRRVNDCLTRLDEAAHLILLRGNFYK